MSYFSHQVTIAVVEDCEDEDTKPKLWEFECWCAELNRKWSSRNWYPYKFPYPDRHIIIKSEAQINGTCIFIFCPHGGSEGKEASRYCDQLRNEFILRAREAGFYGGTVRWPEDSAAFYNPFPPLEEVAE